MSPIVVGGNGHSGTRIFAEILEMNGVFVGVPRLTRRQGSYDLFTKDKLNKWVEPYIYGRLRQDQLEEMGREFRRRLRLLFPLRNKPWGFKNPRAMFILPELHKLYPGMRYIHVIRDGRDMSLGNEFVMRNVYVPAYLKDEEKGLSDAEQMILFWGRSNSRVVDYCREHMHKQSIIVRFEDLCDNPVDQITRILELAGLPLDKIQQTTGLVKKPRSIGRWKTFESELSERVNALGTPYLKQFGYVD